MADKRDVRSALRAYEEPSMLQSAWDEISGAFARYGRRSGAQRDASLAMLNQAVAPGTDPLTGAGMKALGLAGLVTHPLAFFPTGDEWRERTRNAGNTGRMGQAIGGMLGDLPSIVDPHLLAGGAGLTGAMFIGPMAKNFPHAKVPIAEKLEAAGHAADDVHDMTGLHRGADGKWRAEIDDSSAAVSSALPYLLKDGRDVKAGSFFMHPSLYEAYPQLADARITGAVPEGARGASYGGKVGVSSDLGSGDEAKSVLLHEFGHEIQDIEGWAKGGSPKEFSVISKENAQDAIWLKTHISMLGDGDLEKGIESFKRTLGREPSYDAITFAQYAPDSQLMMALNPDGTYRRLAGEVEPRNIQTRMNMTAKERSASLPTSTEDVSRADQLVRMRLQDFPRPQGQVRK